MPITLSYQDLDLLTHTRKGRPLYIFTGDGLSSNRIVYTTHEMKRLYHRIVKTDPNFRTETANLRLDKRFIEGIGAIKIVIG